MKSSRPAFKQPLRILVAVLFPLLLLSPFVELPVAHGASITVNSTCSLDNAIKSANQNTSVGGCTAGDSSGTDTITLTADVNLSADLTNVFTNVRIEGAGFKIDGGDAHRPFSVTTTGNLTLNNVHLEDGTTSSAGGAIDSAGVVTVTNSTISSSSANTGGGAIYSESGTITIANSTLYDNEVTGTENYHRGGAIFAAGGSLTMTHVTLSGNTTAANDKGGGVAGASATVNIRNSIITGSGTGKDCTTSGGTLTITGSVIADGSCSQSSADAKLGSLESPSSQTPHYPLQAGSAAIGAGEDAYCDDYATDQIGNARPAKDCSSGAVEPIGKAITVNSSCTLDNAIKSANNDTATGGCTAGGAGTDVITLTQNVDLTADLTTSTADMRIEGAGYRVDGKDSYSMFSTTSSINLTINNIHLYQAELAGGTGGAAIYSNSATLTVTNSAIGEGNNSAGNGGGIRIDGGTATIANSTIYNNHASYRGGGINVEGGTVALIHVTMMANTAVGGNNGGGIYRAAGTVTIRNSLFTNSGPGKDCINVPSANISGSVFGDGSCGQSSGNAGLGSLKTQSGGAPYYPLASTSGAIDNGDSDYCDDYSADQAGTARPATKCDSGAVEYVEPVGASITVNSTCSLDNAIKSANTNTATGGCTAGSSAGRDVVTLTQNVTLSANLAGVTSNIRIEGAGYTIDGDNKYESVWTSATADLILNNVHLTKSYSGTNGSAAFNNGKLTITNSAISHSHVTNGHGGGIYINAGTATIANSTIYSNSASGGSIAKGGGIYINGGALTLIHVTMSGNTATANNGGGIYRAGGTVEIRNSIITGGGASKDCVVAPANLSISGSIIADGSCNQTAKSAGINSSVTTPSGKTPHYALQTKSDAINYGDNAYCTEYSADQAGNARPATNCDSGAVEYYLSDADATATHNANSTATHNANLTATHNANLTATHNANLTATHNANLTATHNANLTATHNANLTATHNANLTATHNANQTATHNANQTATHNANQTATHNANQTATHNANLTATHSANLTATHNANQTATHNANLTATHNANLTATHNANLTATHNANLTATHNANLTNANLTATHNANLTATHNANLTATHNANLTATHNADLTATEQARPSAPSNFKIEISNAQFVVSFDAVSSAVIYQVRYQIHPYDRRNSQCRNRLWCEPYTSFTSASHAISGSSYWTCIDAQVRAGTTDANNPIWGNWSSTVSKQKQYFDCYGNYLPPDTATPSQGTSGDAQPSSSSGSGGGSNSEVVGRPTAANIGPCSGELLNEQGYRLWATYGLCSGIEFQRVNEYAVSMPSLTDQGFLDAIDVWSYTSQGYAVCFPQSGKIVFLDSAYTPRQQSHIDYWSEDGYTCAQASRAGILVLLDSPQPAPTQPAAAATRGEILSLNNCIVTSTDYVNVRAQPNGEVLFVLMNNSSLRARARASGWFEVVFSNDSGWISAEYVTTSGDCG